MSGEYENLFKELESIEEETRMINFAKISSATSWEEVQAIMNSIKDRVNFALGITAIPEKFLSRVKDSLEDRVYYEIRDIITRVQSTVRSDPYMLFPMVATPELMPLLTPSAQRCYLCNRAFTVFQMIIWKHCQRHTMHSDCLKNEINAGRIPLYGLCGCRPP